jgi:3-hydroxybutyryl-CoA dehydrogenase
MEIKQIFVQGAGTMGSGIAQVSAHAGYDVVIMDLSTELVQKGMDTVGKSLQRMVDKGKLKAEQKSTIMSKIRHATDIQEEKVADPAIEAVFEDLEVKKKVFRALDEVCPAQTILASNTSALPIAAMAASTKKPDKLLGLHFMNPVPLMKVLRLFGPSRLRMKR